MTIHDMFDVLPLVSEAQLSVLDRKAMNSIPSHSIFSNLYAYIYNVLPPVSSQMRSLASAMPGRLKMSSFTPSP